MPTAPLVHSVRIVSLRHVATGPGDPTRDAWQRHLCDARTFQTAAHLKIEPLEARRIAEAAGGWVGAIRPPGAPADAPANVVLKIRPLVSPLSRLKAILGLGRAERHIRGAGLLALAKIPTARTLAGGLLRADGALCEFVAMERLEGQTLLRALLEASTGGIPVKLQHALARAAGHLVAELARNRLFNRDHKPSNIIVMGEFSASPRTDGTSVPLSSPRLALIDPVGVRREWSGNPTGELREMMSKMYIEALGCAVPPRRALCMRALTEIVGYEFRDRAVRSRAIREAWTACRRIIESHGDPRPKTNPLQAP